MATRPTDALLAEGALLAHQGLDEIAEPDGEPLAAPSGRRRALTTTHPEVSCAVCERRLLRGERPQSFLAGTRTQLVCELCTDRALQTGWVRASEHASAAREVYARHRPRRTLLDRLRGRAARDQRGRDSLD